MRAVMQKVGWLEEERESAAGIRHPDVDAVVHSGGFPALDRLSTTLAQVCALLSEHLRSAINEDERELLDRLTTTVGNVFVAVRLSRFEAQGRQESFGASTPQTLQGCGSRASVRFGEGDAGAVHFSQWKVLEQCYRFMVEWEDVEVHTEADAERLRLGIEELVSDAQTSLLVMLERSASTHVWRADRA
jgi:hypothetical protein